MGVYQQLVINCTYYLSCSGCRHDSACPGLKQPGEVG